MAQVIIERPRSSSGASYRGQRRAGSRGDVEDRRAFEPIHRRERGRDKHFNDLFGPLYRFLGKRVGRLWDDVFAEICEHADERNVAGQHLRRHVFDMVETRVEVIDGLVCYAAGWFAGMPLGGRRFSTFYVCPASKVLKKVKRRRKRGTKRRVSMNRQLQYHRHESGWYAVALRDVPTDAAGLYDAWLSRPVAEIPRSTRVATYGHDAYALSARPVNETERQTATHAVRGERRSRRRKRRSRKRAASTPRG